jgi:hypothetical protein
VVGTFTPSAKCSSKYCSMRWSRLDISDRSYPFFRGAVALV